MAESDLSKLLANMRPRLKPGVFVFCSLPKGVAIPPAAIMVFEEAEGRTVIVPQGREPAGAKVSHPHAWIVLQVESDLASVGFLAKITATLAAADISTNAVSAFYHDHLFVPAEKAGKAMEFLRELSASA